MKKQSKRTEEEQKIITTKQPSSIVCSASFLLSRQRRLIGVLAVQRNPDRTGTSHKIPLMSKDHETPVFRHPNRHKFHSFFFSQLKELLTNKISSKQMIHNLNKSSRSG